MLKRRLVRERRRAISPSMPWLPDDRRGKEGPALAARAKERRRGRRPLLRPPRPTGRVFFRGAWLRASASTPDTAERVFFRGGLPRASASTPDTAERVLFRGCRGHFYAAARVFFRGGLAAGIRFYAGYGGAGFLPRQVAAGIREGVGPGVQANRLLSRRPDGGPGGGGVGI